MHFVLFMVEIKFYECGYYCDLKAVLVDAGLFWDYSDDESSLCRKISKDNESILVAFVDGVLVGTLFICEDFQPMLFRIAVLNKFQNRGVGSMLIVEAERLLKLKGYSHVSIQVAANDLGLQKFYEKKGFVNSGQYVWMTKKLIV